MANNNPQIDVMLTDREVAVLLAVSRRTLRAWRSQGALSPIPFVRIGRSVRYRLRDVSAAVAVRAR